MNSDHPDTERYLQCVQDIGILLQKASVIFRLSERENEKRNKYTSSQSFLLVTLLEKSGLSHQELAAKANLEKSSLTRIVQVLLRDGLLRCRASAEDKRRLNIELSPQGRKVAEKLKAKREEYYSQIIAHLPAGHVREVMQATETLVAALQKAI